MHVLIGIIIALAILFAWRSGYLGRILGSLALAPCIVVITSPLLARPEPYDLFPILLWLGACAGAAWFLAGIPAYIHRRRLERIAGVSMVRYQG